MGPYVRTVRTASGAHSADRARRTLRGIDTHVAEAEDAVAGKNPTKRNRVKPRLALAAAGPRPTSPKPSTASTATPVSRLRYEAPA